MRARLACLLSLSTHCIQVPYLFKASFILGIYQSENRRRIYKSYRRMRRPTSYFENTGKHHRYALMLKSHDSKPGQLLRQVGGWAESPKWTMNQVYSKLSN